MRHTGAWCLEKGRVKQAGSTFWSWTCTPAQRVTAMLAAGILLIAAPELIAALARLACLLPLCVQSTNLDGAVDGSRVGLWGVSYGGAHVLVTAARFGHNVSAVIANVSPSHHQSARDTV